MQFFFNLSLVLVFLYLLVQFILTVQRDVEHRIAEYSMGTFSPLRGASFGNVRSLTVTVRSHIHLPPLHFSQH